MSKRSIFYISSKFSKNLHLPYIQLNTSGRHLARWWPEEADDSAKDIERTILFSCIYV